MKSLLLVSGILFALGLGTLNDDATPVDPNDRYCAVDDKSVDLKFKINQTTTDQLELSLNQGQGNQNAFFQFAFGQGWGSGKWSLVLKGMTEQSKVKGSDKAKVVHFEKDSSGKPVNFYTLRHTIVENNKGQQFMQMSYIGSAMPLLDELVVSQNTDVPKSINNRFQVDGTIQFQAGTYKVDKTINGFRIPIVIK
ncbi:MAG: hypothetical protein H6563_06050 [Lewinellaceae bacterium]|nr:hypothetical protein [Lewinellaceae bacterium]